MKLEDVINKNLAETLKINDISVVDTKFTHGLQVASELLIDSFQKKGKVLLAGNGGSAADAQHIAAEFMGRLNFDRDPLPAIALTANSSNITCIANDYGYDHVFSRQANALAQQDDCLIVYSTSGKSKNILKLVAEIRHKVKHIIALTGLYTDELDKYSDVVLSVNSEKTTRIQEIHAIAGHILCECVEDTLFGHLKNS